MDAVDVTLAARGQIVIPKVARDSLGRKPGSKLRIRIENGRLLIEKHVQLDLSRWACHAIHDGPSIDQALAELRGREVPWKALKAGAQLKTA